MNLRQIVEAVIRNQASAWLHAIRLYNCETYMDRTCSDYGVCDIAFESYRPGVEPLVEKIRETCKSVFGKPVKVNVYIKDELNPCQRVVAHSIVKHWCHIGPGDYGECDLVALLASQRGWVMHEDDTASVEIGGKQYFIRRMK